MKESNITGIKFDKEKLQWHLLPMKVLEPVMRVLMFGAKKYAPDNWMHVKPKSRYYDACMRHMTAWQSGEINDKETGENHLAHAIASLIFLLWHDRQEKDNEKN